MNQEEKPNSGSAPLSLEQKKAWGTLYFRIYEHGFEKCSLHCVIPGAVKSDAILSDNDLISIIAVLLHTLGKIFGGSIADMLGGKICFVVPLDYGHRIHQ